ncbi:hypothetical protein GGR52DRAFT_569603 [Hypoxylon sp. FL1284]|nr:hypothetical protein GGR52DRAFT_569603 [Hypoxylon sp. FL1284]
MDIVITGIRRIHDDGSSARCLSMLLPQETLLKPTPNTKAIIPMLPTIADPATTINSVQPSFSLIGCSQYQDHCPEAAQTTELPTSVIESREFSRNASTLGSSMFPSSLPSPSDPRAISPMLSPTLEDSSNMVKRNRHSQRLSASEPVSPKASFGNLKSRASRHQDGSMTCFPKLLSRTSTSDWLTPLGLFGESSLNQHRATTSDLYACGVDAHCGTNIPKPLGMLEESPRQTPAPVEDFQFTIPESIWFKKSEAAEIPDENTGHALGISSHQRKSLAITAVVRSPETKPDGLLDQLRRYSFMPLVEQMPESIRRESRTVGKRVATSLQADWGRKSLSQEMLQGIMNWNSSSNKTSRAPSGVSSSLQFLGQQTRTGSQTTQKWQSVPAGRVSCSEDQVPHVCMDELLTPLSGSEATYFE